MVPLVLTHSHVNVGRQQCDIKISFTMLTTNTSVAFCSPAKCLTLSGLIRKTPILHQSVGRQQRDTKTSFTMSTTNTAFLSSPVSSAAWAPAPGSAPAPPAPPRPPPRRGPRGVGCPGPRQRGPGLQGRPTAEATTWKAREIGYTHG